MRHETEGRKGGDESENARHSTQQQWMSDADKKGRKTKRRGKRDKRVRHSSAHRHLGTWRSRRRNEARHSRHGIPEVSSTARKKWPPRARGTGSPEHFLPPRSSQALGSLRLRLTEGDRHGAALVSAWRFAFMSILALPLSITHLYIHTHACTHPFTHACTYTTTYTHLFGYELIKICM